MTKKHFIAIAKIIREYGDISTMRLSWELAKYFATTNKLFDQNRFFTACGVQYAERILGSREYDHQDG